MKIHRRFRVSILLTLSLVVCLSTIVFADTDGTEPQITQQPDQLILQLGARWAGVEFELRTDAGVFPVPVVVDENGVLTMDLGGSSTYILSCINSSVPIPDPIENELPVDQQLPEENQQFSSDQTQQSAAAANSSGGIPTGTLILFLLGLACAVGGLIAIYMLKRRRQLVYDDWDEEDDEEY